MQDHTEKEYEVSISVCAGRRNEVRGFGFEEVVGHEMEARLQVGGKGFFAGFEGFGVVLDEEFGVGEARGDGETDVPTAASYLV